MKKPNKIEDQVMAYDEWKTCGYYVMKGQRAHSFDGAGIAQFRFDQVTKIIPRKSAREYHKLPTKTFHQECSERALRKGTPQHVVEDFDSFVREAGMLPTDKRVIFNIRNPLEQYFMNVADKHGVLDQILDPEIDEEF